MRRKIAGLLGAVLLVASGALPAQAGQRTVNIVGQVPVTCGQPPHPCYYNPDPVNITVGDSIVWHNSDSAPHTATADTNSTFQFDTGNISGDSSSDPIVFSQAGQFTYHCTFHDPPMRGTVVVSGSQSPSPSPSPSPSKAPKASPSPSPTSSPTPSPSITTSASPGEPPSVSVGPSSSQPPVTGTITSEGETKKTGGGTSTAAIVAIVAVVIAAGSGVGLWLLRRRSA